MKSLNIQFHMLYDELINFVADVCVSNSLSIELERWHPKVVREVSLIADLHEKVRDFGKVDRIWLRFKPRGYRKAEHFMLNVGNMRGNRLAQCQLGAGASNSEAYEVLKHVAKELRRRTPPGVWVITAIGTVGYTKRFRVSRGAAAASRAGEIELVDIAFGQSFRVDEPQ